MNEPKTVGMRDNIFSYEDIIYLEELRKEKNDNSIGRYKGTPRLVPLKIPAPEEVKPAGSGGQF